jgi:hypothetical protein
MVVPQSPAARTDHPHAVPGRARPDPRTASLHARVWATALLTLSLGGAAHAARPSSIVPANQPVVGPQSTLEAIARGYRDRSVDSVAAHYTADWRFHAYGDTVIHFVDGVDRKYELGVLHTIFEGVIRGADTLRAPADSVGITMDGFREGVDPEHPDSTQHYQVVEVGRFEMGLRFGDARLVTRSKKHVFHFVRGDVAHLVAGQPADSARWYVRRWLEDVSGVLESLSKSQGDCGEPAAPAPGPRSGAAPPASVALAIRPLTNPACAKLEVSCDLPERGPARIDVYDVGGRRMNRRELTAAAPGRMTIEAGAGAKLPPGPYWVRISQGKYAPATRMVLVAR